MKPKLAETGATVVTAAAMFLVLTGRIAPRPIEDGRLITISSMRDAKPDLVVRSPFVIQRHQAALNGTGYLVCDADGRQFWVGDYNTSSCGLFSWAEPLAPGLPVFDKTWANPELSIDFCSRFCAILQMNCATGSWKFDIPVVL